MTTSSAPANDRTSEFAIIGAVVILTVTMCAVTTLSIFGKGDVATIAGLIGLAGSVIAVLQAMSNRKIDDLHHLMNSRLTELVDATARSSHAEGLTEGRAIGEAAGRSDQHTSEGGGTLK